MAYMDLPSHDGVSCWLDVLRRHQSRDYLGITSHKTAPVWVTIGQAYKATNEGSEVLSTTSKGTGEGRQKHGRGTENEAKPRQEA